MILVQYNHFEPATKTIAEGETPKSAYLVLNDGASVPSDYTAVTDLCLFYENVGFFKGYRHCIFEIEKEIQNRIDGGDTDVWGNCTPEEKELLTILNITLDDTLVDATTGVPTGDSTGIKKSLFDKVAYYTVKFMTENGKNQATASAIAQLKVKQEIAKHNSRFAHDCEVAVEDVNEEGYIYDLAGYYISKENASDMVRKIREHVLDFEKWGITGLADTDVSGAALYDFIESTAGTEYEFTGLAQQGYTILNGTVEEFITDLLNWFKYLIKNEAIIYSDNLLN